MNRLVRSFETVLVSLGWGCAAAFIMAFFGIDPAISMALLVTVSVIGSAGVVAAYYSVPIEASERK